MKVTITEKETGKVVAQYTINLGARNYTPKDDEYFSQAWESAVEDGAVDQDSRGKYEFSFTK